MRLASLFSGGKDSAYSLYLAGKEHDIVCLISMISKNDASYMFHVPNIHLVPLQAEAMGLPLLQFETAGIKEEELEDLKDALKKAKEKYQIEGIVTGAIASNYQRERIQKLCDNLNLKCINPLWGVEQIEFLNELVDNGFKVIITGIFAYPLTKEWLGKEINKETIEKLAEMREKYKINPSGEGGEIETTTIDGPTFKRRIKIIRSEIKAEENSGVMIIKKAVLEDKA
jgi:diphthine-ammonia ligase